MHHITIFSLGNNLDGSVASSSLIILLSETPLAKIDTKVQRPLLKEMVGTVTGT